MRVPRHLQAGEAGPHRAAQQGLLRQLETFIKGWIAYEHYRLLCPAYEDFEKLFGYIPFAMCIVHLFNL